MAFSLLSGIAHNKIRLYQVATTHKKRENMYNYELAIKGTFGLIGDAIEDVIRIQKEESKFTISGQDWFQIPNSDDQSYTAQLASDTTTVEDFVSILQVKYPALNIMLARM